MLCLEDTELRLMESSYKFRRLSYRDLPARRALGAHEVGKARQGTVPGLFSAPSEAGVERGKLRGLLVQQRLPEIWKVGARMYRKHLFNSIFVSENSFAI